MPAFGFFPFQMEPPSEEQIAEMKEMQARAEMHSSEFMHSAIGLLESADVETLNALYNLFVMIEHNSDLLHYFQGICIARQRTLESVCLACGKDHMAELLDPADAPAPVEHPADATLHKQDELDRRVAQAIEYHVKPVDEWWGKFVCTGIEGTNEGCGLVYETLEDRIVKEPEDCHGCFIKASHG